MYERRTVIISGGCGGVGRVVGKKLAEDGFDVIALYRTISQDEADAVVGGFVVGNHRAVKCDIRDEVAVEKLMKTVLAEHETVHACVHAAVDPILWKNVLEMTRTELEEQFGTGVFGGFALLKGVATIMKERGEGAIVGILSRVIYPDALYAKMSGYTIEKFALRGLLKELYRELLPSGVRVNAVAPNIMDTKLVGYLPKEVRTFMIERAPGGSVKMPKDVADIISHLFSPQGKSINGKIFSFEEAEVTSL